MSTRYCVGSLSAQKGSVTERMSTADHQHGAESRPLSILAAWNAGSWLALAAYNFALTAVVYRAVGATEYGVWATIVAIRTVLLLVDGGLSLAVVRDAARSSRSRFAADRVFAARRLFFVLGTCVAAVGVAGAGVPAWILELKGSAAQSATVATALLGLEAAFTLWGSPYAGQLRGNQRFDLAVRGSSAVLLVGLPVAIIATPVYGLVGAGVGALAARVAAFLVLRHAAVRRQPARRSASRRSGLAQVFGFAAPMWIVAIAGQLSYGTDVPLVGALFGPVQAGAYAVGAILPAAAIGLLYMLLDSAFPRLSAAGSSRRLLGTRLVFFGCMLAALGFLTLIAHASAVLIVWVGDAPQLGLTVMAVYALAWSLNVPTHVLILMSLARGRHGVLARIAIGEATASLLIGLALVLLVGPVGPAIGTLVALAVSNLVVTPAVVLPRLGWGGLQLARAAGAGYLAGAAAAFPMAIITTSIEMTPTVEIIAAFVGLVLTIAVGAYLLRLWMRTVPLLPVRQD